MLRLSVFSHFFAVFVPLTIRGQGYPWSSFPTRMGLYYAGIVCAYRTSLCTHLTFLPRTPLTLNLVPPDLITHLLDIALAPKPYLLQPAFVDWTDQIVLVTGGASGLGGLLSETLAMRGVRVVVLDVRKGEWEGEVGGQSCCFSLYKGTRC